jgi:hypothetical protein
VLASLDARRQMAKPQCRENATVKFDL